MQTFDTIIVGGGFTGVAASLTLSNSDNKVLLIEKDSNLGGLAGSFSLEGTSLDKFYHHWFTSDNYIIDLISKLGLHEKLIFENSNTGIYYSKSSYKMSTPLDLLRFKPLSLFNRLRLGLLTLYVRRIKDWMPLESMTAEDWLIRLGGKSVYEIVWRPLLMGKFGKFYKEIGAVWFWNKLKLRGGSRDSSGEEKLVYLKGGFAKIAEEIEKIILERDGQVLKNAAVRRVSKQNEVWLVELFDGSAFNSKNVLVTTPFPIFSEMIKSWAHPEYLNSLGNIKYIGNVCLVLVLTNSLSDTYWLNINDTNFPFVGIIEHTNLDSTSSFRGKHIVYLSKYLPTDEKIYSMTKDEFLNYAIPYIEKIFPEFNESWITDSFLWKSPYSQPLVFKDYSKIIPEIRTPYKGLYLSSMAQIYPEDRGTNYAVREGYKAAELILNETFNFE